MSLYKYYSDGDLYYLATPFHNSTLSGERRNYHSDQRLLRHGQAQCSQAALCSIITSWTMPHARRSTGNDSSGNNRETLLDALRRERWPLQLNRPK
ncbi:hypothetical protein I312_101270 [Cryptococcus bacillisporus CA1280]|uniref:uncharacterized protein n=1 Tax=Cryptococcus bacillisporus CA1280 TaxID=1296109 RepID=UPI0033679460